MYEYNQCIPIPTFGANRNCDLTRMDMLIQKVYELFRLRYRMAVGNDEQIAFLQPLVAELNNVADLYNVQVRATLFSSLSSSCVLLKVHAIMCDVHAKCSQRNARIHI